LTKQSSIKQQLTTICKHGTITSRTTVESHCSKISETASLLSSSIPPDCLTMVSSVQSCYQSHEAFTSNKPSGQGVSAWRLNLYTCIHLGVVGAERLPVFFNCFSRPTTS